MQNIKNWVIYPKRQIYLSDLDKEEHEKDLHKFFLSKGIHINDVVLYVGNINECYIFGCHKTAAEIYINDYVQEITIQKWYEDVLTQAEKNDLGIDTCILNNSYESINSKRIKKGLDPIKENYDFIKPQHYKLWKDNNDVNDVIRASLTKEEYQGFIKGNILKYQLRLGKKPNEPIERDQEKIKWYQEQLK